MSKLTPENQRTINDDPMSWPAIEEWQRDLLNLATNNFKKQYLQSFIGIDLASGPDKTVHAGRNPDGIVCIFDDPFGQEKEGTA